MTEPLMDRIPWRGAFEQTLVYAPEKRPGFDMYPEFWTHKKLN